jgi:YVTN family beta-propeller protein
MDDVVTGRRRLAVALTVRLAIILGLLSGLNLATVVGVASAGGSPAPTIYVADAGANNVAVIDGATGEVVTRVPVGTTPEGIAITPNGATVYTVNECGGCSDFSASAIDTATDKVVATIPVGTAPDAIAIAPNGATAYVANAGSRTVSAIDTHTNKVVATIPVGNATAIAITPDGRTAYVTDFVGDALDTINLATDVPGTPIPVGAHPSSVAISPDGATAYVTNQGSDDVWAISTGSHKVEDKFGAGRFPNAIAVTPDGSTAYVANYGANTVWAINTATGAREADIPVGTSPWAVAVEPDGAVAYVANERSGNITAIDTATNKVLATIGTGSAPYAITFGPPSWSAPAPLAAADTQDSPALAFYQGTLFAAWKAAGTDDVRYSANNGSAWSAPMSVSGTWGAAVTGHSPALVSYGGDLYAFWTTMTGTVSYSAYNGTAWSEPATVPGALTDHGPAATTQEAKTTGSPPLLWVTWSAKATGDVWFTSYNGTSWASEATTLGVLSATAFAPAVAEDYDGNPYIAWRASSGQVDWEILIGLGEKVYAVPGALTSSGPALSDTGHTLYFAFKGKSTNRVLYLGYDGSAYTAQQSLPRALTNVAPALSNSGGTLCAGWKGATTGEVYDACLGKYAPPSPPPVPTTAPVTTPTSTSTGTVVTVTAGSPMTYTFELSTTTQPKVVSDEPAIELTVPLGEVTFNVTDPEDNILSYDFKVCSAPLPGPVTSLAKVQELPDSCGGTATPLLAPGGASATLKVDFAVPGAYEYLSTAGGLSGDASAGMKGVLNVT